MTKTKTSSPRRRKLIYDVSESLRLCPPCFEEGVIHKGRMVVNMNCIKTEGRQCRQLHVVPDNVNEIKESLELHGWKPEEPPLRVTRSKDGTKEFDLLSGHNRFQALRKMGEDCCLIDVLEFQDEMDEHLFPYKENTNFSPRRGLTINDCVKGTCDAIEKGLLDKNDDAALRRFIDQIAPDKNQQKKDMILSKVRENFWPEGGNIRAYDNDTANERAKELNLQYRGSGNNHHSHMGYVSREGMEKRIFVESCKGMLEKMQNGTDDKSLHTKIYMYVKDPCLGKLNARRSVMRTQFKEYNNFLCKAVALALRITMDEATRMVKDKWQKGDPFQFGGFLDQNHYRKGGLKREDGLVDENGVSMQ